AKNKKMLVITSKAVGKATLALETFHYTEGGDKDKEPTNYIYDIEVTQDDRVLEPRIEVSVRGITKQSMRPRDGKLPPIGRVRVERQGLLNIEPSKDDPARILDMEGVATGRTRLYLYADGEGFYETYEVSVVEGIDFLRALIRETFPTAVVDPRPGPRNTII